MGTRAGRIGAVIHVGVGGLSTQTHLSFRKFLVHGGWPWLLPSLTPRTGGSSLLYVGKETVISVSQLLKPRLSKVTSSHHNW